MAASSSPINGTAVLMRISEDGGTTWDTVAFDTSASLSTSQDLRDVTTKDSEGWSEKAEGLRSWSLSGEGLVTYSTSSGKAKPNDLYALLVNRTKVKVKFGTVTEGDQAYTGDAYLTQYEQSSGVEDNNTFSYTLEGTGPLVQAANAA